MRSKLMFLAGAAVGYVLGTRDGRGRYEQMKSQADALWNDPRVQEKVTQAGQAVKDKAPEVQAKVAEATGQATEAAKAKVGEATDTAKAKAGDAAGAAKAKTADGTTGSGGSGQNESGLTGAETGSNYTPAETKFNSAN